MNQSNSALTIIADTLIATPDGRTVPGSVVLENGRIREIRPEAPGAALLSREDIEVVSGQGCFLTPGLVETHFNGGLGCNLNDSGIREIQQLLARLPAHGITSVLLTAITAPMEDLFQTIQTLEEVIHHQPPNAARVHGLHLEGPFINPKYRGSHPEKDVLEPGLENITPLLSPNVKMVTLAPELDAGGSVLSHLVERGILVSAGHSGATYEDIKQAMGRGLSSITHLFNAQRPFHHRDPGFLAAAVNEEELWVQIIGDGDHVAPAALEMILRAKHPRSKLILVSDAYPMAGLADGAEAVFGRQRVTLQDGQAKNEEGRLVGGHVLLDGCVRNLVNWNISSFGEAIQLATANPAAFLGIGDQVGVLEAGKRADLVLWDQATLTVRTTWIGGKPVYNRNTAAIST